jgi:hypothetical protein
VRAAAGILPAGKSGIPAATLLSVLSLLSCLGTASDNCIFTKNKRHYALCGFLDNPRLARAEKNLPGEKASKAEP